MNIFNYHNYRLFLKDFLAYKKEKDLNFSQRSILKKMKITSTGFLANVLSGRNNLTANQTTILGEILKLKKKEKRYFEALVPFTQAKTIKEKNQYLNEIVNIYKSKYRKLPKEYLGLYSKWYNIAIIEIIALTEFTGDFRALSKIVKPKITETETKAAIKELEKLELIKKDDHGVYRPNRNNVKTYEEIKSLQISNFLLETMTNAKHSMDNTKNSERDISALSIKISENKMKEIKAEIRSFRKKILQMAELDENRDRVYQCNINFFPISENIDLNKKNSG